MILEPEFGNKIKRQVLWHAHKKTAIKMIRALILLKTQKIFSTKTNENLAHPDFATEKSFANDPFYNRNIL